MLLDWDEPKYPVETMPPDVPSLTTIGLVPLVEMPEKLRVTRFTQEGMLEKSMDAPLAETVVPRTIFCVDDHTDPSAVNSTLPAVVGEMLAPSPPLAVGRVPLTPEANGKFVALVRFTDVGVPSAVTFPEALSCGERDAAIVMNTFLVPAENVTADPALDEL
jgi:hypothetical protein